MAVIKVTNSKAKLSKAISYVTKEQKTEIRLISGKDCTSLTALEEMKATKEQFNKLGGRQYCHYVQSFAKTDNISYEKAHEIATEWAEKNFKGHEVLIATHKDKEHTHTHFIVNNVNFEDGKKLHSSKKDLAYLKLSSDQICEREGLSVIHEKSKEITSFNQKKYKAIERALEGNYKSYVVDTALAINKVLKTSTSKEFFIKGMESQGYSVKWNDTNKNVTFTNAEGEKIRLNNLKKTFKEEKYCKEGLENEFTRLREKELVKHREPSRTERNTGEFGLSWDKSEIGTSFSGADNCLEPHDEADGAKRERQNDINKETPRERNDEGRANPVSNQSSISNNKRNQGNEDIKHSESGRSDQDIEQDINRESRISQANDKGHYGLSISSKEYSKSELEGKSETILNSDSDNSRIDSRDSRSLSTSNPLSESLEALDGAIKKMEHKEQILAEKELTKLEEEKIKEISQPKEKETKKRRKKDYDIEL
jgi:hypothetical protein